MGILIAVIILAVVLIIIPIILYNTLVRKRNQVDNAFGSVDAMLKKRYDLIPNLVSTVKNYMEHEKELLTKITELRTQVMSEDLSQQDRVRTENELTRSLGKLKVAVENYPDLKSNQNFLQLQASLNEVEEQISAARRTYNAVVTDYNNTVEMFPTNIMAGLMKYKTKEVFEIPESERQNINVNNLFNK